MSDGKSISEKQIKEITERCCGTNSKRKYVVLILAATPALTPLAGGERKGRLVMSRSVYVMILKFHNVVMSRFEDCNMLGWDTR